MLRASFQKGVVATKSATVLLEKLQQEHGPLVLYHPKGCVGRTGLQCFPSREFLPSSSELKIGEVAGAALYIRQDDLAAVCNRQIVVDVGRGSGGLFALERRLGVRFFARLAKRSAKDGELQKHGDGERGPLVQH